MYQKNKNKKKTDLGIQIIQLHFCSGPRLGLGWAFQGRLGPEHHYSQIELGSITYLALGPWPDTPMQ